MRILHLHIDGFGILHDVSLNDLPSGLVLFAGDNEAGKTTCLSFIRDMLFGFRDGRSRENSYLPLAGGQYGGRLTLMSDRFGEAVVERRPGKRGGNVIVSFSDGRKGGEESLRQLLGATTRDLFRNIYAFSLAELQTIETLDNETVKSVLYGAATGTATLALPTALATIDATMGKLFKPGGRNPEINQKIAKLEEVRTKLREARKDIDRYDQASLEFLEKEKKIEETRSALVLTRQEKDRAAAFIKLWEDWLTLTDLEKALQNLPVHVDTFPEEGLKRLEALLERIERDEQLLRDLRTERADDLREIDGLFVDEEILEQSRVVQELLSRKEIYLRDCSSLLLSRQNVQSVQAVIEGLSGDLGKEWTEDKVRAVDRSLFTRETILKHQEGLDARALERQNSATLVGLKKDEYEAARRDEDEAKEALERYGSLEAEADEATIRVLQNGRDQFASVIEDLPRVSHQLMEEKERILSSIREINPAWEERNVNDFDCSIGARQKVQRIEVEMAKLENETTRITAGIDAAQKELEVAQAGAGEKTGELDRLGPQPSYTKTDAVARKSSLRLLRTLLGQKEKLEAQMVHEEARLLDKRQQREEYGRQSNQSLTLNLKPLSFILALSGVAIFLVLSLLTRRDLAVFAGTALILVAAILFWLHGRLLRKARAQTDRWEVWITGLDSHISVIEAGLEKAKGNRAGLRQRIGEVARPLSLDEEVKAEDIDILETTADEEIAELERKASLHEQQEEWNKRAQTARKTLQGLDDRRKELEAASEKAEKDWEEYLRHSGLPADITTRTVDLIFVKVENIRGEISKLRDMEERVQDMEEARTKYVAAAARVPSLGEATRGDPGSLFSSADAFLKSVREMEVKRSQKETAAKLLEDRTNRRKMAERELAEASNTLGEAIHQETEAMESWRAWLANQEFSEEISPSTVLEALHKISDCVRNIGEKQRLKDEIRRLGETIEAYEGRAGSLFAALGEAAPPPDKLPAAIDRLSANHDQAKTNQTKRKELSRKVEGTDAKIKNIETDLLGHRRDFGKLLEAGGAMNEDELRLRGRLFEEKKGLISGIAGKQTNLKKISGEEDIDSLRKELESLSLEQLKVKEADCLSRLQDLEHELEGLRQGRAELNQKISSLASADDISRWRAEEEVLLEEIRVLARDWARHALAKALLGEARRRFEQEQQPKVISDAGTFFGEITGGKYEKVVAPIGGDTIEIVTRRGEARRPEMLSRGTAEQLYLAIRFGYITNYLANGESLPVIMDDVLVNFDPNRAEQTTKAILSLAETHQVLYFTCHPETVDLCRSNCKAAPVFTLRDGKV